MIITIDGPAGSGKSTAARKLAARLGIAFLDTGAMYRVITLYVLENDVDLSDDAALAAAAEDADYKLDLGPTYVRVTLCGRDVTEEIRSMRINDNTRYIAASPGVRRAMIARQREIAADVGSLVSEGRDQGSAAFPSADMKFYMDAAVEKRAERRLHELLADGQDVSLEQVLANVEERDASDSKRAVAPLTEPAGAIHIDSTSLPIADVIEMMLAELRRAGVIEPADDTTVRPA
jgi:cytidylate kinase